MPVIEVEHLHEEYGDKVAVDDVSFTVEGLRIPDGGTISVLGLDPRHDRAASGIGSALLFPMPALGGVWVPKEQLPPVLQHVADVLPPAATLDALRATWAGDAPELLQLGAMAAVAVAGTTIAARVFRWG